MIEVIRSPEQMKKLRSQITKSVGFVPTMGALHDGHANLIQHSVTDNTSTIVSIFVNPTQFNNIDDLNKYPKTFEQDLKICQQNGVQYLFYPDFNSIYPDQYKFKITENDFSNKLCGAHRPGHFDGVLTVVMKLLNICQPTKAYFGEKDFQQLHLIKGLSQAFFLDTEIIAIPTVREKNGLAMSSRNTRLSESALVKAAMINKIISESKSPYEAQQLLTANGFDVDYVSDYLGRRFVAASIEGVRLIDNVQI